MIAELFKERSRRFTTRCAKYSRYVFNDHFILILLFLLGFVLVQYSQLLRHFPKNPWAIILGLLVLCLQALNRWQYYPKKEVKDKAQVSQE